MFSTTNSNSVPATALDSLRALVQDNNLPEIRNIVNQAKSEKPMDWEHSENKAVECAVRDAILQNKVEIVKFFLEEAQVAANSMAPATDCMNIGVPYLYFAGKTGNLAIVKLLVENGAKVKADVFSSRSGDDVGISEAIKAGHAPIVEYLLNQGANARGVTSSTNNFRQSTFLGCAALNNQIQIMELLLDHGAFEDIECTLTFAKEIYGEQILELESRLEEIESQRNESFRHYQVDNSWLTLYIFSQELDERRLNLSTILKNVMDYAMGVDFSAFETNIYGSRGGLTFASAIDISGVNFVGVSVAGYPVTRKMLNDMHLKGAERALVTISDIKRLSDQTRRDALLARLSCAMQKNGELIQDDRVNLVPLWRTVGNGDTCAMFIRLHAGADPNQRGAAHHRLKDSSPIGLGAQNGYKEAVQMLIDYTHYINQPRAEALMVAIPVLPKDLTTIINSYFELDKKLIVTAIESARTNKHTEIADYLSSLLSVDEIDQDGNTLLHVAVKRGDIDQLKHLIDKGANVNLMNKDGNTALKVAVSFLCNSDKVDRYSKYVKIIEFLLQNNADANLYLHNSPLSDAVNAGCSEAVALLLPVTEKKAVVETNFLNQEVSRRPWYVSLMFSALRKFQAIEILSLLRDYGADFNEKGHYGYTLLCLAIESLPDSNEGFKRGLRLVDFLLNNFANPQIADTNVGETPLHQLFKHNTLSCIPDAHEEIIHRLVNKGADIEAQDNSGKTPLHIAASKGVLVGINYLANKKVQINVQDADKRTPLHLAAMGHNVETVKLLLKLGADPTMVDVKGLTALELSKSAQLDAKKKCYFATRQGELDFDQPYNTIQGMLSNAVYNRSTPLASNSIFAASPTQSDVDMIERKNNDYFQKID